MTSRKVLIVDDDRTQLLHLQRLLDAAGYFTLLASDGDEAVAKASSERPDAILMDVNMPGMNGFDATRAIKTNGATKDIPVIFVTAKNQKADKLWATMQGAKGFVSKPFSDEDILLQLKGI